MKKISFELRYKNARTRVYWSHGLSDSVKKDLSRMMDDLKVKTNPLFFGVLRAVRNNMDVPDGELR